MSSFIIHHHNYEAASVIIQKTMDIVGEENEDLNAAYNEYRSHLPVYITDVSYMSCDNNVKTDAGLIDNIGNTYHSGLVMYKDYNFSGFSSSRRYGKGAADYYINGNYQRFSGTVGVQQGFEDLDDKSAFFEVYGDGKLLYTSSVMTKSSLPETFDIDISGVKILRIEYSDTNTCAQMATIYDGLLSPEE